MKAILYDIGAVILLHIVSILALSGIAMFVWNFGAVALLPSAFVSVEFVTATALMTGIYMVDMIIKTYLNRITAYRREKNIDRLLFQRDEDKQ